MLFLRSDFFTLSLLFVNIHILLFTRSTFALNLPPLDPTNPIHNKSWSTSSEGAATGINRSGDDHDVVQADYKRRRKNIQKHSSNFQAKQNHPTSYDDSPAFKGPIILQRPPPRYQEHSSSSSFSSTSDFHTRLNRYYNDNKLKLSEQKPFNGIAATAAARPSQQLSSTTILQAIVDHFAYCDAPVDVKEVCESVEFYIRTKKRMFGAVKQKQKQSKIKVTGEQKNNPNDDTIHVLDCCAGHGLTGMLFAACNPYSNVQVTLIDLVEPPSHQILKDLLIQICPWVKERVTFSCMTLEHYSADIQRKKMEEEDDPDPLLTIVIATHACGFLTDQVLELGANIKACGIAAMPCCYTGTSKDTPYGVKRALGVSWAADIRRSFFLTENGYHADFATIPSEITPMNRILVGERRN
mmetsp:Transcript_434/g.605  ORF Transcript_434/g.605 Transcript_434/m.605 type:complete len:411 (-) Transcript_434:508-1740(-)